MSNKWIIPIIILISAILCVLAVVFLGIPVYNGFSAFTSNVSANATANAFEAEYFASQEEVPALEEITTDPTPTLPAPTATLTIEETAEPAIPTETPAPTATPFTGIVVNECPSAPLGRSPINPKEYLAWEMYPYPGDPEVICVFEAYSDTQDIMIILPAGGASINADWLLGYQRNENGDFIDECQELDMVAAPQCEGTWVATQSFFIPKGDLVKLYVYAHEYAARLRFTHTLTWENTDGTTGSMLPFACEYVGSTFKTDDGRTIVHNEDSIRVPNWPGLEGGTIYEFRRTLDNPLHCPDGILPAN